MNNFDYFWILFLLMIKSHGQANEAKLYFSEKYSEYYSVSVHAWALNCQLSSISPDDLDISINKCLLVLLAIMCLY